MRKIFSLTFYIEGQPIGCRLRAKPLDAFYDLSRPVRVPLL